MPNISLLADKTARLRRTENLSVPAAVWKVLRAERFAERTDAKELHGDICAELQKRSTARRKKNLKLKKKSAKIPEQLEFSGIDPRHKEALQMIAERNGDPDD